MTASIHYLRARREAIHHAERQARATYRTEPQPLAPVPQATAPARISRWRLLLAGLIWALLMAAGLWLAAHDPLYLSRAMSHLLGEVPA